MTVPWIRAGGLLLGALALLAGGCQGGGEGSAEVVIQPGGYEAAFVAARSVLREADFRIEREDAYSGVITTQAKTTAGWATPGDQEQRSAWQETEDLLNRQSRVVRVEFASEGEGAGQDDLRARAAGNATRMRVFATLSRRQRPGWRLETAAVRASTRTSDPDRAARGMEPEYDVAVAEDRDLAAWIAGRVRARLDQPTE
jgi:hypothetical protein